jgi:peptidoglycan/LPS O-acetylase OafA/YrhL
VDVRAERFPLVDSLRAIAALSILFFHLAGFSGAFGVPILADLSLRLPVGVTLFFLISGFLLYRPFVAARIDGRSMPALGPYAWRRFLRIVPAYWAALTVVGLLVKDSVWDRPFVYYGFAQVYTVHDSLGGLAVAWSLCAEVTFYAMLPLYALLLARVTASGRRWPWLAEIVALSGLVVIALGFRLWYWHGGGLFLGAPLLTLPAFLDWFALGMGLAVFSVWLGRRETRPAWLGPVDRWPGLAWAFAAVAFCLSAAAAANLRAGTLESFAVHLTYAATAFGLLLPAVIGPTDRGLVRKVMALPVLAWLGLVSYGIYLWQGPVIAKLGDWTGLGEGSFLAPNTAWLWAAPPVVVAVAAISYYALERPALSLKRMFPARRGTSDQPGAVSAPPLPERP